MGPQLTVLMAVHNGGSYLGTSIDSILEQTYRDFRFLIVDDASTDHTREAIRSYEDDRIELICLDQNVGQTAALNVGLLHASTPWIARMDADDFSASTRLEEQMNALAADPSISCLGTYAWIFRDDPLVAEGVIATPIDYADIKAVVSGSPIIHGSIIFSREAVLDVGAYNDRYRISADVDLYDRLLPRYRATNLPRELLGVRRHPQQASNSKAAWDESIEISSKRLLTNSYTPLQVSTIRSTLSRAYVSRARHRAAEGKFVALLSDVMRALVISPKTFLWGMFVVFVTYNFPERKRASLMRVLRRLKAAPRR